MLIILHLSLFLTPIKARKSPWPNMCHSSRRLRNPINTVYMLNVQQSNEYRKKQK